MSKSVSKVEDLPTADKLREHYNSILSRTDEANKTIGKKIHIVDMGETQQQIQEAMVTISRLTRKDSVVHRKLTKWLPFGWGDKSADHIAAKAVEGKTVHEVTTSLMTSLQTKRERVEEVYIDLEGLLSTITNAHGELDCIIEGINENWDDFTPAEQIKMRGLKAEILQTREYHRDNILTAQGALHAAEASVLKLSEIMPQIRSQINDGMSIRGALKELESMTEMADAVGSICEGIREENRSVMTDQLMSTLERTVISDQQIASIASNQKAQAKLHKDLSEKLLEVHKRRDLAISKLEQITDNSLDITQLIGIDTKDE